MLKIVKNNLDIEVDFNGIKIFDVKNPNLFYKEVFLESSIYLDEFKIKDENIIYINNFSKISDFITLSKKSFLFTKIYELIHENNIINYEAIKNILNIVNETYSYELLDINDGDNTKLINMFFELCEDKYIDKQILEIILNYVFEDKKLIVFDNIEWIDISFLSKYINQHNFIVLTNNFYKYISFKREFEILTIFKENYDYSDIIDVEYLCAYLQSKLNININSDNIIELINKNNEDSYLIHWTLRNI